MSAVGERPGYYADSGEAAIIMWGNLAAPGFVQEVPYAELILAIGAMAALMIGAVYGDKSTKFLSGLVVVLMAVGVGVIVIAPPRTCGRA